MNGQKSKYTITDDDMGKKQSVCEAVCISKPELDVMLALSSENYKSQRDLAEKTGYSLKENRRMPLSLQRDSECEWYQSIWKHQKRFWKSEGRN